MFVSKIVLRNWAGTSVVLRTVLETIGYSMANESHNGFVGYINLSSVIQGAEEKKDNKPTSQVHSYLEGVKALI